MFSVYWEVKCAVRIPTLQKKVSVPKDVGLFYDVLHYDLNTSNMEYIMQHIQFTQVIEPSRESPKRKGS